MSHIRLKMIVGGVVLALAVSLLAVSGIKEGWVYYLPVDEFVVNDNYADQRVRLHGTVGAENLEVSSASLVADFDLLGDEHSLRVQYAGVIPDMFKAGQDVVIEGRMGESGTFQADLLMTKCASKYESEAGQAPHADPNKTKGTNQ